MVADMATAFKSEHEVSLGSLKMAMSAMSAQLSAMKVRLDQVTNGKDGANGRDGIGIADALIDKDHSLVLTLTDGTVKKLGVVVGRDGVNGQKGDPGRDGFGFDDLSAEFDGERTLTLAFVRGEDRKAFPVELPHTIYRGVFADGTVYQRGDAVTWGGSIFIAKETTADKPGTSPAWTLAVKRGRDGREGKSGPAGERGPKGDKGDR
jgi:hypothetical protein